MKDLISTRISLTNRHHPRMTTPFKSKAKPNFIYPNLPVADIMQCLHTMQISVEADEIKNPTPDSVIRILYALVTFMTEISRESLRAAPPQFAAVQLLSHPELHEESVPDNTMKKQVLKMLRASGVNDASWMDLMQPTAARVRSMYSAVINFARFKSDRMQTFDAFAGKFAQMKQLAQSLETEHEKLVATIADLEAKQKAEEPQVKKLEVENNDMHNQIAALNKEQVSARDEAKKLKDSASELEQRISEEIAINTNLRKECERLKSQIVRSPERMKKTIADMHGLVGSNKRDITELEAKGRELRLKHQTIETLAENIQKRNTQLIECCELSAKSKKIIKEIRDENSELEKKHTTITEAAKEHAHIKASITEATNKLFETQSRFAERHKECTQKLAEVEGERAKLMRLKEKDHKKIEENESLIAAKKAEMIQIERDHKAELSQLQQSYQEFAAALKGYHLNLLQAMSPPANA